MKKFNAWTHNYAEKIDGLVYAFPFKVGDHVVVYFKDQSDEINNLSSKFVLKVIQVGVPIKKSTQISKIDVFGDLELIGTGVEHLVEGARIQVMFHKDGIYEDMGHGYKENLPVDCLRKVERPENVITKSVQPVRDLTMLKLVEMAKYERKRKQYKWN